MLPATAATAPLVAQLAVTVTVPSTPIETDAGKFQIIRWHPSLNRW
jgi:hypothetical protein